MAIAHAVGAQFIRVNVLVGARVADQGLISGIAENLLRFRREIGAEKIRIFADVDVKHSAPLAAGYTLEDESRDAWERGGADALIVTGGGTGWSADPEHLRRVHSIVPRAPLLIGSGTTLETLPTFLPEASGFIVGTALKKNGKINPARVRAFEGVQIPVGTLDITLHRDDLRLRGVRPLEETEEPPGGVDGRLVVLVMTGPVPLGPVVLRVRSAVPPALAVPVGRWLDVVPVRCPVPAAAGLLFAVAARQLEQRCRVGRPLHGDQEPSGDGPMRRPVVPLLDPGRDLLGERRAR
jgi:hypothetical protein